MIPPDTLIGTVLSLWSWMWQNCDGSVVSTVIYYERSRESVGLMVRVWRFWGMKCVIAIKNFTIKNMSSLVGSTGRVHFNNNS